MDVVFIEDLRIETVIGIYDWERKIRQVVAFDLEMAFDNRRPAASDKIADTLDYGHRPLPQQFDLGVRQIELDVYADPTGGKYSHPSALESLGIPDPDPKIMNAPGFKVMHQAYIDNHSTCLTFVLCLRAVKTWSDAHPGHVPMMIDVEMKDPDAEVTSATFDALDSTVRAQGGFGSTGTN